MSAGTLSVVATPIGNLEDITLRALRVLREARVIAAEDTRRTAKLLARHGIVTPTISFHQHNSRRRIPELLGRLRAGEHVALVTDAGTPGVSDPGTELVHACVEAGIPVDPIPGPSAPLVAAVASGFPLAPLAFFGFPPNKGNDRIEWFADASRFDYTLVFFEAPHRIAQTLSDAARYFGDRPIMIGRELTKVHQEFLRGTAQELATRVETAKGEYTVVVGPGQKDIVSENLSQSDDDIAREFWQLINSGVITRRQAVSALARKYARSAREVYAAIERSKKPGV